MVLQERSDATHVVLLPTVPAGYTPAGHGSSDPTRVPQLSEDAEYCFAGISYRVGHTPYVVHFTLDRPATVLRDLRTESLFLVERHVRHGQLRPLRRLLRDPLRYDHRRLRSMTGAWVTDQSVQVGRTPAAITMLVMAAVAAPASVTPPSHTWPSGRRLQP